MKTPKSAKPSEVILLLAVVGLALLAYGLTGHGGKCQPEQPAQTTTSSVSDDGPQDGSTDCWTFEMCAAMGMEG